MSYGNAWNLSHFGCIPGWKYKSNNNIIIIPTYSRYFTGCSGIFSFKNINIYYLKKMKLLMVIATATFFPVPSKISFRVLRELCEGFCSFLLFHFQHIEISFRVLKDGIIIYLLFLVKISKSHKSDICLQKYTGACVARIDGCCRRRCVPQL